MEKSFRFKQFGISFGKSSQKVTTDSVLLGSWVDVSEDIKRILDIGAGTGLLALMMAQRCPGSIIDAIEIDTLATFECKSNFKDSPWSDRLNVEQSDFGEWYTDRRYDLIICNPPYFSEDTLSCDERRNLARHGTSLNVESLIRKGAGLLNPEGSISLVCPARLSQKVVFTAGLVGLNSIRECAIRTVESKPPLLALFQLSRNGTESKESLNIRDRNNLYTEEYKRLTSDFYLFLH